MGEAIEEREEEGRKMMNGQGREERRRLKVIFLWWQSLSLSYTKHSPKIVRNGHHPCKLRFHKGKGN